MKDRMRGALVALRLFAYAVFAAAVLYALFALINGGDARYVLAAGLAAAGAMRLFVHIADRARAKSSKLNYRERGHVRDGAIYLVLAIGAIAMLIPFYWMFTSAFKTNVEINRFPPAWLPRAINFENFTIAFGKAPFGQYFLNSVVVMICSVACTGVTTILGAFAFSRLKFPGREVIFALMLSLMMIPFEMLIITNYTTVVDLKLYDTIDALILPFTSSIFYTYILRNFFKSVPDSLYYSARIDGASNWTYLWKVLVPMARPSLVTIMLLNALASWNSFMWPMYVTSNRMNRTLPWGLQVFTTEAGSYPGQLMAASTVVVLPVIILFLFARKYIVRGVARGGMKG
ncbi:MAG: carbohydrate ABC transporter permease [Christensenellales bacterium]|jgi:multiple sugar transport system permease protein